MKAAFVIFDGMTALDFVGFYDPVTRLKSMKIMPDFEWRLCSLTRKVADERGLRVGPDVANEPLAGYDLLFVPGGWATRELQRDAKFVGWLKSAAQVPLKISVCTGALLLGAAGFLEGRRATTHPGAHKELAPYCRTVVAERIVDEGDVVTAGGVSASIDLGLHIVQRLSGVEARQRIARQMDYPYRPA